MFIAGSVTLNFKFKTAYGFFLFDYKKNIYLKSDMVEHLVIGLKHNVFRAVYNLIDHILGI